MQPIWGYIRGGCTPDLRVGVRVFDIRSQKCGTARGLIHQTSNSKYIAVFLTLIRRDLKFYRKIIPGCVTSLATEYGGVFDQQEALDSAYQTALVNRFNAYRADEVASDMRCLVSGSFQMKSTSYVMENFKQVHGSIKPPVWSPLRRQVSLNPVWSGM